MIFFFILISFYASVISAQPYVLSNFESHYPRIAGCVTNDTFIGPVLNKTECGPRSDGCNWDTGQCVLAQIFGYELGQFLEIIPEAIYSAQMPGVSDGAVNVSIAYLNFTFTSPQGILQLWRLYETKNGVDIFEIANREVYLLPTPPNLVLRYTYYDLPAGFYRAVFFDWGGTRFGSGFPESSVKFEIKNVFPVRLLLSLRFVEEYRVTNGTGTGGILYPETLIKVANKHFMGYRLIAEGLSEATLNSYLINAASLHNRPPAWIWRSDQGNIITTTVSKNVVCNPAYLYETTGCGLGTVDSLCSAVFRRRILDACSDPMWTRHKIFPMNTGGYGTVIDGKLGPNTDYDVVREGRKNVLEFRLNYAGFLGTTTYDYWAHRQTYFQTTVVSLKKIQSIQLDNTEGQTINLLRTGESVAPFNHVRRTGPRDDLLVVYYVRYSKLQIPGRRFAQSAAAGGLFYGLLQYGKDSYGPFDMRWGGDTKVPLDRYFGATGFPALPYYVDHTNFVIDNDYSCFAVGTEYARTKSPSDNPNMYRSATFADIGFSFQNQPEYNGRCTIVSTGSPPYVPCNKPVNPECELCCQMNTRPGGQASSVPFFYQRNYPCFRYVVPGSPDGFIYLQTGSSKLLRPFEFLQNSYGARHIMYNDFFDEVGGSYVPLQVKVDYPTSDGGWSWSVFPTLKDYGPGDTPDPAGYVDGSDISTLRYIYDDFVNDVFNPFFSMKLTPWKQNEIDYAGPLDQAFIGKWEPGVFVIYNQSVTPLVTTNDGVVFGTVFPFSNSFPPFLNPAVDRTTGVGDAFADNYNVKTRNDYTLERLHAWPAPDETRYEFITNFYGTVGFDTTMGSLRTIYRSLANDVGNVDFGITEVNNDVEISSVYARFKVYPRINFHNFRNAIFPRGSMPASIDVEFKVSCPLLEMGYGEETGYCAQSWFITNQNNDNIILSVTQGTLETDPDAIAAANKPAGQVLGPVKTEAVFIVRVIYNNNDVLHWEFNLKAEPEKPFGHPSNLCRYSTLDTPSKPPTYLYQFVPPLPTTVTVPPQEYVLLPMIVNIASAQPACEYNPQEVRARVKRSQYFNFAVVNDNAIRSVDDLGQRSETQLYYYYDWKIGPPGPGQRRVQGFSESTQLYSPDMELTVYDNFFSFTTTQVNLLPVDPLYPNPLLRPPRCVSQTLANATCPVNIGASDEAFSGINQYQYCVVNGQSSVNTVALTPRFIFIEPYSYLLNVGSCFFNITTAYVTPAVEDMLYGGIFEDCRFIPFIVDQNNAPSGSVFVSLKVRYGITIASFKEDPCWERLITQVYVLSDFTLDPLPVQFIDGCVRPDGCCYRQLFTVQASSPFTGQPINLDNSTDPCIGLPFCEYEIIVSPPANDIGGLCLGVTYTFTVQSPQTLVNSRLGPYGNSFPLPWRCPNSVTITLPYTGFSPLNILTTPGPCTRPGTDVRFDVLYTDVSCEGPISAANVEIFCRRDLYFAIQTAGNNTAYNAAGAPSITSPFRIDGINTIAYNNEGSLIYPQRVSPFLAPVPNGIWNVYFWAQPSGTPPVIPSAIQNPGNVVSAQFVASLAKIDGININRLQYIRPQCPGTPILLTFVIYDIAFNGPYYISFLTPGGALIANTTIGFDYCPGFGLDDLDDVIISCAGKIQSTGISIVARIPTGNVSNGETGLYTLFVFAERSECPAVYEEFVTSMETLRVQIECFNTTCPGGRDGNVNTEVTGGTSIPVLNITTYQGSNFDIFRPLYYYYWDTPQGPLRTSDLFRVPEGFYSLRVYDFNNCTVPPVSCTVGSISEQMTLIPISQTPPNCTGEFGNANFTVAGGVAPYTLFKISNRTAVQTPSYSILADSTVLPNQNSTYVVIDDLGCVSPSVSFFLEGSPTFFLTLQVVAAPCNVNSATGSIQAFTPGGLGTVLTWINEATGQVVSSSSNCLLSTQCLLITNLPASTYRVIATSTLYGCTTEAKISLQATPPPDIQINRFEDPNSVFLDSVAGTIFSSNGPPYTVTFYAINFDVPVEQRPIYTQDPPSGNLVTWTLTNLPAPNSFQMRVIDNGNCVGEALSVGRQITEIDNLVTPTPIPGQSGAPSPIPDAEKIRYNPNFDMILVIYLAVIPFAIFSLGYIGYRISRKDR